MTHAIIKEKTPIGITPQFKLNQIILQGSVLGPLKCSVQMDSLGRDSLSEDSEYNGLYKYKSVLDLPALGMLDDVLGVSVCSYKSIELNVIINSKIECKNLRLSGDKCYKLHISKKTKNKNISQNCPFKLKVHSNELKSTKKASYLGDILNEQGSFDDSTMNRRNKAIGITNQIMSMITSISLGMFYFQICFLLRESMFLNAILTNVESWAPVSQHTINTFVKSDTELLRRFYNAPLSTCQELLFLEGGRLPINFVISKRRLMYLWHILTRDTNELVRKVYFVQSIKCTPGDWFLMIQSEKIKYKILLSDEEISKLSKNKFKTIVNTHVEKYALSFLIERGKKHSKSQNIIKYMNTSKLQQQKYLSNKTLT